MCARLVSRGEEKKRKTPFEEKINTLCLSLSLCTRANTS